MAEEGGEGWVLHPRRMAVYPALQPSCERLRPSLQDQPASLTFACEDEVGWTDKFAPLLGKMLGISLFLRKNGRDCMIVGTRPAQKLTPPHEQISWVPDRTEQLLQRIEQNMLALQR